MREYFCPLCHKNVWYLQKHCWDAFVSGRDKCEEDERGLLRAHWHRNQLDPYHSFTRRNASPRSHTLYTQHCTRSTKPGEVRLKSNKTPPQQKLSQAVLLMARCGARCLFSTRVLVSANKLPACRTRGPYNTLGDRTEPNKWCLFLVNCIFIQ